MKKVEKTPQKMLLVAVDKAVFFNYNIDDFRIGLNLII